MVDEDRVLRLLRSILVHDYVRVNDEIVIDCLKALGDLEEFVSQVASFVTRA